MSKFSTTIPINVQEVIAKLPVSSFVHSVTLLTDRSGVEIIWDNDKLKTAYTFPMLFPLEKLFAPVVAPEPPQPEPIHEPVSESPLPEGGSTSGLVVIDPPKNKGGRPRKIVDSPVTEDITPS